MRIVGGKWRGRALKPLGGLKGVRPTSDRVREAIFNILMSRIDLDGATVLDLFAGTGAMGLEALSRGAERAVFVEKSAPVLAHLRSNVALFPDGDAQVLPLDAGRLAASPHPPAELCFCDPPYGKGLGQVALERALEGGWLSGGATVILEENEEVVLPSGLTLQDVRRYGDTVIHLAVAED